MEPKPDADPRIAALPDIHGHAKGEHKPYAEERPIPYTARMLFLWFYHACRRSSPRFVMVADHMNYLTFEDPSAVNLVRRALKLAQAGDLYGAAETAGVELGHAAVVSEGLRRGMRYSIGAEIDNDPRCRPDAQNIVDAMKPDGMIRSVHFLPITHPQHGENWMWAFDNPEFKDLYDVVGPDKVWEIYVATVLEAIDKLPGHIIGHFYVPAKFGHWPPDDVLETYEDRFLAACAERGLAVEVNSRYFYKYFADDEAQREKYRAVHLRLLRKAKERGVMIAVGSDAHSPRDQGNAFDIVLALLDEAEINEIAFPLGGRLARVALRATEEILREHSAALAAPAERSAHGAIAAGAGDDEFSEPDDDAAGDAVPAQVPGPPAAAGSGESAASEAAPGENASPTSPARNTARKRASKKTAAPLEAALGAARAVSESVVALAEKAAQSVAAILHGDDARAEATPSSAPPAASDAPEVVPKAAVATGLAAGGALATVAAARAARTHAPGKAEARKSSRPGKAPPAKAPAKASAKAPLVEELPGKEPESVKASSAADARAPVPAARSDAPSPAAARRPRPKPDGARPDGARPDGARPAGAKPAGTRPVDTKSAGVKTAAVGTTAKAAPGRPATRTAPSAKAGPAKTAFTKPSGAKPSGAKPSGAKPSNGKAPPSGSVAAKPAPNKAKPAPAPARAASRGTATAQRGAPARPASKAPAAAPRAKATPAKAAAKKSAGSSGALKRTAAKPSARKAPLKPVRPGPKASSAMKKTVKTTPRTLASKSSGGKKSVGKKSVAKTKNSRARR